MSGPGGLSLERRCEMGRRRGKLRGGGSRDGSIIQEVYSRYRPAQ